MVKEIRVDKCKTRMGKWGPKAYLYLWYFPSSSGRRRGREVVIEPHPLIFILPLMLPLVCVPSKVTKTSQGFHFPSQGTLLSVYQHMHITRRKEKVN